MLFASFFGKNCRTLLSFSKMAAEKRRSLKFKLVPSWPKSAQICLKPPKFCKIKLLGILYGLYGLYTLLSKIFIFIFSGFEIYNLVIDYVKLRLSWSPKPPFWNLCSLRLLPVALLAMPGRARISGFLPLTPLYNHT
jgi:hypothetical protein